MTGLPPVTHPTAIVSYPNPYDPGYNTVAQLVGDSGYVVVGTLGPVATATGQDGTPTTYYQINVQKTLSDQDPRNELFVSSSVVTAARLSPTGTYIFFWAEDTADKRDCIVGGVRGVMTLNPSTSTVTRLDQNTSSQIPRTQTLTELESSVQAAINTLQTKPITNLPPACSLSATGLSQ